MRLTVLRPEPQLQAAEKRSESAALSKVAAITALVIIITIGLALRAYGGVGWGLPDRYHPDEPDIIDRAARMIDSGDPNPRWFLHPSLYIYVQAAVEPVGSVFQSVIDSRYDGDEAMLIKARQLAVGRLVTVIIGTISILLVFLLGRSAFGVAAGLAAAAILAVHVPHIVNSQYVRTDVPAAAAVLAVGLFTVFGVKRRSLPWILGAAVMAGVAAGAKYNAGVAVVMPLVASVMVWRGLELLRNSVALVLLTGAAFLCTTPYALLEWQRFWTDVQFEMHHYSTGHPGAEGSDTWRWYLDRFLLSDPFTGILMGAGILYAVVRRRPADLILLSFMLPYYLLMAVQVVRFERALMPIVPLGAVLAGRLAADVLGARVPQLTGPAIGAVAGCGLLVALALSAADALDYDRRLTLTDSRAAARDWIMANIPTSSRIVEEFYTPTLGPEYKVDKMFALSDGSYEDIVCGTDYVVASSGNYARYFVPADPYPEQRQRYERLFQLPVVQEIALPAGPVQRIMSVPKAACPDTLFRVSWTSSGLPDSMPQAEKRTLRIAFQNTGSSSWTASGPRPVHLSYHWRKGGCGGAVEVWDGVRTALPANVEAGSAVEVEAVVKTPNSPGAYCLQFDLVKEKVDWFSARGGTMLSKSILID